MEYPENKTKEQLILEVEMLRNKVVELEKLAEERPGLIEELKESEEKYKSLYENAPLSYQSLNEDGSFRDVNPAWLQTLGYKREEVIGKYFADFLHPDWKTHFETNFPAFKKRGYVHDVQFKIRHKDGHYIDISFEGCIGYLPDGSFKQTYCVFQDITERRKAEEKLFRQIEFGNQLINSLPGLFYHISPEGRFTKWNKNFETVSGYSFDEMGKISPLDLFEGEDMIRIEANIKKVFIEGNTTVEAILISKTGQRIPYQFTGKLVEIDNNPLLIGMGMDITKNKQAQDELNRNRNLLIQTSKLGKVGGWEFNIDTLKQIWTEETYRIHELDMNIEPTIEMGVKFYTQESIPIIEHAVQRAIEFGEPFDVELDIVTAKNNLRSVKSVGEVDLANRRVYGFFQDITERKMADKQLQETSMLLTEILNTIPIRVFWKDLDLNYLGCNLPFAHDAGLAKAEDVVGKTDYQMFVSEHARNFRADDRIVIESGIPKIGFEEPQENNEGFDHWLRTSKVPLKDKAGKTMGVLGTYEDITEKKQAEEELKKYRDQLEVLVQERTAELESKNKELNNAMKVFVGREMTIRDLQARIKALGGR